MENADGCNALLLPARNKKKRKTNTDHRLLNSKAPRLSKSQQRKLRRLQEEKEKKDKSVEVLETLEKYKLAENAYALLHASGTRGQRESMREKLRRALHYDRAGLTIPTEVPLFHERRIEDGLQEAETEGRVESITTESTKLIGFQSDLDKTKLEACSGLSGFSMKCCKVDEELCRQTQHAFKEQPARRKSATTDQTVVGTKTLSVVSSDLIHDFKNTKCGTDDALSIEEKCNAVATLASKKVRTSLKEQEGYHADDMNGRGAASREKKKQKKGKKVSDSESKNMTGDEVFTCKVDNLRGEITTMECNTVKADGGILDRGPKIVVHVSRSEEVTKTREKLPIIMMEQEIMEAITENPVTIICGETGCGKTTQVPQFLYEAGFSASACLERAGMIGVTQPRRVAVLATAKRLSHEMNLRLGQEVGFQVRHDRKVGNNTRIKFMTDGILLREVQSDFLLRKYSVIVLDEAHERSLNTDILIGMLSRVLPLRQSLYEEQRRAGKVSIYPLKLVIMSATLLVDEFVANRKLFTCAPPMVEVPARQFPVTVHFSAKTELVDYVGKAYKKVCSIHKRLPPGGVLVFLTGQAEVHYLCKRLQKAFPNQEGKRKGENHPDDGDSNLKDISDVVDGSYVEDAFYDETERAENWEVDESTFDSSSESDLEFSETEDMPLDIPEPKCDSEWSTEGSMCLKSIKNAFDIFTGTGRQEESEKPAVVKEKKSLAKETGPLYVLPLYALLPAASQLKIFDAVPEGSRLVVVATNVAETSITIPGIRYVVDCGRVKEKIFERASGITRYEVGWISKASAAQRAGRSGRTGPGHCYRLYSSAIFNDTFPDFSQPEIYRAPIEGLVLLLKSMMIVKVDHFPFLSEPDKTALKEAEHCLHALSALDSDTGLLTPLGQAISLYPISPRHSRMLLTAMQIGSSDDIKETSMLLAYAGATVAALSLDSPFMTDIAPSEDQNEVTAGGSVDELHKSNINAKAPRKNVDSKSEGKDMVCEMEFKKSNKKLRINMRYRHHLSDALGVVAALRAYEVSNDPEEFCRYNSMHARILYEMSKLRKQLIHIYVVFSKERGNTNGISSCDGLTVADVEGMWKAEGKSHELSVKHENVLRQAVCAGWADRVAHKVSIQESLKSKEGGEKKRHKAIQYQTCNTEEKVYVHPSSSLRKNAPEFVVFNELVRTSRPYMKIVTSVDAHWLVLHANALCTFSKPLSDPPPWYDNLSDDVFCWVSSSFGPHLWQLPLQKFPLKGKKHRVAVFACAFLQGKVLPGMKDLYPHLAADPSILLAPSGNAHKRASELLHVLEAASVDSRCKLQKMWDSQSDFLFQEIILWVQKNSHSQLERLWTKLKLEAHLDGKTLFGSKKKK
eukprot:c12308_g1_i1 orf=98-4186(+)